MTRTLDEIEDDLRDVGGPSVSYAYTKRLIREAHAASRDSSPSSKWVEALEGVLDAVNENCPHANVDEDFWSDCYRAVLKARDLANSLRSGEAAPPYYMPLEHTGMSLEKSMRLSLAALQAQLAERNAEFSKLMDAHQELAHIRDALADLLGNRDRDLTRARSPEVAALIEAAAEVRREMLLGPGHVTAKRWEAAHRAVEAAEGE